MMGYVLLSVKSGACQLGAVERYCRVAGFLWTDVGIGAQGEICIAVLVAAVLSQKVLTAICRRLLKSLGDREGRST